MGLVCVGGNPVIELAAVSLPYDYRWLDQLELVVESTLPVMDELSNGADVSPVEVLSQVCSRQYLAFVALNGSVFDCDLDDPINRELK